MESTFLQSLRQRRADAVAERDRLDERIRALDVLITQESPTPTPVGMVREPAFGVGGSVAVWMTLPAAVTTVIMRHGKALGFPELRAAVSDVMGQEVNEKSLRGTLSRMEREGKIVKPRRGMYALPTNAESAAVTALSVVPAPTSDEGRTDHVEGVGDGNDHLPGWNDSDGRSTTPVVEA